jgi:ribokinase
MVSAPDVVTVGGVLVDHVATAGGALRRGQIGGNALYSAAGAALWGLRAAVCAHVPANYPAEALALLTAAGLDLSAVRRAKESVEFEEWFFYRPDGSRRDQLHASAAEAEAHGMGGPFASPAAIAAFEAHLSAREPQGLTYGAFRRRHPIAPEDVPAGCWQAIGVHLAANGVAEQIALARAARARGMIATWDPGPRAVDFGPEALSEILGLVDAALPSETELAALMPGLAPAAALVALKPRARGFVAVKLGAEGVLVLTHRMDQPRRIPATPSDVIDLTGAGDAFCGGVLAGLCRGEDALEASRRGVAGAGVAVSTSGPLALLAAAAPNVVET